jgi:SNF2 family DNA or RNA helicase
VQDLPEKVFIRKTTTLSDKAYKTYKELENEFYTEVEGQQITALNVLTKLLRLQQITGGYLPDDEGKVHKIDDNKRKLLADVLEDIDSKEPLVIFARFHNDMNEIANVCDKAGLSWCELSGRINQLKDFQRGDYDVIIVQIKSGGVGVDLTRARYALYYSIGHSLGDYQQSLKRVHRPGQDRTTYFIHLVVEGTVDVKVEKALVNKKEIIDEVLQKGE